jgi:hypothetical protein
VGLLRDPDKQTKEEKEQKKEKHKQSFSEEQSIHYYVNLTGNDIVV